MTSDPLFAILGPIEVDRPGAGRLALGGPKSRQLLTLLVLHRNRAVPPDRLAASLYGETPPKGAEVTLRSHISHLRRRLAEAALDQTLVTGPAGYTLVLAPGQVDADRFEQLVGLGQEALGLGHAERAVQRVREALELWRGQPYADLDDVDAAGAEEARLQELHLVALETLATAQLASGRHGDVVGELQGLVAAHPFRERFCAQLMVALYRSGRQADALAAYTATRERLAEELGLDPGPELQDLAQAVLRQDPVLLGATAAPTPPPTPVGRATPQLSDAVLAAATRTPLVGRTEEVARVEAAWRTVAEGGRRLLLLSGEAGIGKTRVVAGLAHRLAEEGQTVLVGRCESGGAPYHSVAGAMRSSGGIADALRDAPAPVARDVALLVEGTDSSSQDRGTAPYDDQRLSLYKAVEWVLGRLALAGPVLLVIEDADRIDRASSLLLRHLVDHAPAGLLVVICYRDPPGGRHPPLLEILGAVAAGDLVERLAVGPLSEGEVAALVGALVPDADPETVTQLWQHAEGNPYYATEMARARAASPHGGPNDQTQPWRVPSSVRDALRLRLTSLSDTAQEVLRAAAVLGSEVDVDALADMTHVDEDELAEALDEAVTAGLLVESGRSWVGSYAFPHELTREAVRGELTGPGLRRLHAQAARALMSRFRAGSGKSPEVAVHLQAAGSAADPNEAAEWSLLAAHEAKAVFAWDEAIEQADAAFDLVQGNASDERLAEVAVVAANLRLRSSRGFDQAVTLLEAALRRYVAAGMDSAAGTVHSRIGGALSVHHSVMDIPRALEHFEAAERLLGESEGAFHVNRGRSQAAMFGLRTDVLAVSADRAAAVAADMGRRDLAVFAGWAQAWAAFNEGRLTDAAELHERSWATAHELSDPYLGWMSVNAAALVANAYLLDPEAARRWCRRGLGQPRFTSLAHSHDTVVDQLALALAATGELASAREVMSSLRPDAVARRMMTFLDGDWEQARDAWAGAVAADEAAGDLHDAALNLGWLASATLALGDRDGALAAWERALDLGRTGPQVPTELAARAELARLSAADDLTAAAAHLHRCDVILAAGEDWRGVSGRVELARAEVAEARGDHEQAAAHQGRAVEVFTDFGLPWHRADALWSWARFLAGRGRDGEAEERRRQADQVYRGIGAAERWRRPSGHW